MRDFLRGWFSVVVLAGAVCVATCSCAPRVGSTVQALAGVGTVSVVDFGALGDGVTDDRAAIQAALSSGAAEVVIPDGTYLVGTAPAQWWALHVTAPVRIRGTSRAAVLRQAAPAVNAARMIFVDAPGVTISSLTFDGQRALQTTDEHRAGIFGAGDGLVVQDVDAHDFTGDGLVVYYGADHARIRGSEFHHNTRNGLTMDATDDDIMITDNSLHDNDAQQLDSEPVNPSVITHVVIAHNTIDTGATGDGYALTVVGASMTTPSSSWRVVDNTITGGVQIAWISDVAFSGNTVVAGGDTAPITVLRWTRDVVIADNTITYNGATDWRGAVYLTGTLTAGQQPTGITVAHNTITNLHAKGYGLRVDGISDAVIARNTIVGPGVAAPLSAGIRMRATNLSTDFARATITDNTIRDFGDAAIMVQGTLFSGVPARLDVLELERNAYVNTAGTAMTRGAALDDGTHALQRLYSRDNASMAGVTTPMVGAPANSDYGL